jgi:hypothetical protein
MVWIILLSIVAAAASVLGILWGGSKRKNAVHELVPSADEGIWNAITAPDSWWLRNRGPVVGISGVALGFLSTLLALGVQ